MSVKTVTAYLAAAVATGGTIAFTYPQGTTRGDFVLGARHKMTAMGKTFVAPENMTVSLGATTATVTYQGATTIPASSRVTLELDRNCVENSLNTAQLGGEKYVTPGQDTFVTPIRDVAINLGSPTTKTTTSLIATTAVAGIGAVAMAGTKVVGGVGVLGAPTGRGVQVVSSNAGDTTQTITVRGKDMYGQSMSEAIAANGTAPVLGKKAFLTVTSVTASAALAGNLSVGDTDVLGLPVWLGNATFVWRETQDGAVATAGTIVAGLGQVVPSATSADVRGTYLPNAACDGSKACILLAAIPEPNFYGPAQFTS